LPTDSNQFGSVSTEMKTPETKDSITMVNGPMVEALSTVVVSTVTAIPSAAKAAGAERDIDGQPHETLPGKVHAERDHPDRQQRHDHDHHEHGGAHDLRGHKRPGRHGRSPQALELPRLPLRG
jgi:hypothetical protein